MSAPTSRMFVSSALRLSGITLLYISFIDESLIKTGSLESFSISNVIFTLYVTKSSLTSMLSSFCLVAWRYLCSKQSKIRLRKNYCMSYYLIDIWFWWHYMEIKYLLATVSLQP